MATATTKTVTTGQDTLDTILANIKDVGFQLTGLNQNVNTVGQVVAGQTGPGAGAAGSQTMTGGINPKWIAIGILAAIAGYFVFKHVFKHKG